MSQRTGVQIAGGNIVNTQTQFLGVGHVPLAQPFAGEEERPESSPLGSLRAFERREPLVGRDDVLEDTLKWMEESPASDGRDDRALVIFGPGGAGKTRLAAEILQVAKEGGWRSGFLAESARSHPDLVEISHPAQPTMVAVDYAEARHNDLRRLFAEAPVEHERTAPFRLILVIREGIPHAGSWLDRIEGDGDLGPRAARLLRPPDLVAISLEESLPSIADREALWEAAAKRYADAPDQAPAYLSDPLFERPLFVLLDAHRAVSEHVDTSVPPTESSLVDSVLKHERRYWTSALAEAGLDLGERRMNQVAAVATLTGGVARSAFESALRALDWLRDDHGLRQQVADCWCTIYATGQGAIRGVEPDVVGEHLAIKALSAQVDPRSKLEGSLQVDRLRSLIGLVTTAGRQRILRVLTRIAAGASSEGAADAKTVLAELLEKHLDDFLPATIAQAAGGFGRGSGAEPLAMTIAAAVLACDRLQLVGASPGSGEDGDGEAALSGAAVRSAARGIVRQQIESVAKRELAADRWTVDRFADVMAWAVRFDLAAGNRERAERELHEIAQLDPKPHRSLAVLRREIGRDRLADFRAAEAKPMFEAALADLDAVGERDSHLGFLILGDLGDAVQWESPEQAAGMYEQAFEGLWRTAGPDDESTLGALADLVYCLGHTDLEAALERIDVELERLAEAGASEETMRGVRADRARAMLAAGRAAASRGELDSAKTLLHRAGKEANDGMDSLTACVIAEEIAYVESSLGEVERALAHREEALEGKRRLRGGYADSGTISTLVGLARELRATDVDRAIDILGEVADELRDTAPEHCQTVVSTQADILRDAGRSGEAMALLQADHVATLTRDVRGAVSDALASADAALTPAILPITVALDSAMLAAELFAPEDPRLPVLASSLGMLVVTYFSAISDVRMPELSSLVDRRVPGAPEGEKLSAEMQSIVTREAPTVASALNDTYHGMVAVARGLKPDPVVAELGRAAPGGAARLVDVEPVRRWLLDCALRGPTPHGVGAQAITLGALLSWVLGTRAGRLDGPPHAEQAVRFWRAQSDAELIAGEEERLEEELCRVADIESGEARALVRMGTASALTLAARQASTEGDLAEAEALCIRGLRQLEAVGREKSELGWIVAELRCDVASAQGDFQRATRYGEAAFIGRREAADGSIDQLAIGALIKLATCKARIELSEALCLIDEAIEGLADERDDTALSDLHRGRVQVIGAAGMAAREAGDQAMAGRRYEEALDALTELGERDSRLGHALVHNWAVAAADAGERETSVTLLERALDGRRRLLGRRDPDALSSLCLLASTLAEEDAGPALSLLDAALRELVGDGATPNEIARVRRARASVLLGSGRAAESEENLDRAANSYNEALQELIAIGEHDSLTAYVVMHDLGDVALANGESEIAAARYREAFEGKRRLSGLAVGDTLRTLVALTEAMASSEEEAAVAMIDEAIQDLVADRCDDTQLDMLRIARVRIRLRAGQTAAEDNRLGDAERAFQAAQAEVQGLASPPGHIARSTTLRMAGLEERRGEHARARALCREGLEGWDELGDDERGEVLGAVTDLAHVAVERDPDWAIEMMDGSIALVSATGNPQFVGGLRRNLAVTLLLGARAAAVREELGLARRLCARSLDALDAAGKRDSLLAFVVVHEDARFCDLAGDEQAVALYREAVEGKRRLVGLAHEETISSYLGLADAVAGNDLEQALALLDEPIEELGAVPEAGQLVDRLREGRARAHLSAGRVAEAAGDLDRAERLYAQALEESEAAQGVAKSILTPVLTHDLADVAAKRMDRERAIELYEEALEGKRRLRGLADDATITTLLSLTEVLAEADLPAALARLDEAIQTLAGDAGGIELRQRLREGRAAAHLIAGRSQEAAGSLDEAERLFQATLGELESAGLRDGMLAFSAVHDLGDVARQREDFSQAAEHYEKALAGRRRILGLEHEQTLGTAAAFAEVLCRCDLPAASELSESILRELSASGCEDRALAHGRKIRARVLQAMGREAEGQRRAGEARQSYSRALELLEQSGDRDSTFAYGLVRDLADVAALEGDADRAAALYREAFDGVRAQSGASHQLALACLNGLVLARPADRDASLYLFADAASELEAREAVAEARQVRRAYAHTLVVAGRQASEAGEVDEAERCYREALDQLVAVGERESISAFVALHDLGDVAMMREDAEQAVDLFRAALAGKRRLRSLAHGDTITTLAALVNALNAVDHSQAIELLEDAFGELRGASVAKDDLVPLRELRAAVVLNLGRDADRSDDPRAAERLYRRALDELSEIDRRDSSLAYTIVHDLADARLARGKRRRALKLYREALEGKRRLHGPASEQSVVALLSLANAIALSDLAGALATIDRAIAELGAGEAAAGLVKELRDGRAVTHLEAGRTAEVAGNLDDAQSLYEAVLAELAESGRRDSTLAYVVVHDLGDVALKRGDAAAAAALFEESLQGKWRLRGLAHADTITTLLRLADALVETDSAAALTMLEGHAEELAAQEETAAVARIDSWLKTRRSADDR